MSGAEKRRSEWIEGRNGVRPEFRVDGGERRNGVENGAVQKWSGEEMEHCGNGESGTEPMGKFGAEGCRAAECEADFVYPC